MKIWNEAYIVACTCKFDDFEITREQKRHLNAQTIRTMMKLMCLVCIFVGRPDRFVTT